MADPMWRQIADDLRQRIESGELGAKGRVLPSELELREHYDASRNTVRDAVKWLVTQGLVVTRPGQGTFVTEKIKPYITRLSTSSTGESAAYTAEVASVEREAGSSVPRIEIQKAADSLVGRELHLKEDESYISRHQERTIDGTPWSLQTTFYPMRLVQDGATNLIQAEDILEGAVRYIEKKLGIKQAGWRDRITVRRPDQRENGFFRLPDGGHVAVFAIIRTGFDEQGVPLRVTITTYPTDRNEFIVIAGDVPAEVEETAWHVHPPTSAS